MGPFCSPKHLLVIKTHSLLTGLSLGLVSIPALETKRVWPDTSGLLTQLVRVLVTPISIWCKCLLSS